MPRASIAIRRRLFLKQQSNMPPTRSQSVHARQVPWRGPGFWQGARDYDVPIIRSSNRRCCRVPCSIQQQIEPGHPTCGRAAGSWHTRTRGLSMVTHNQVQVTSWPEPRSWFSHCWPEPRSTAGLVSTKTSRLPPSKRPLHCLPLRERLHSSQQLVEVGYHAQRLVLPSGTSNVQSSGTRWISARVSALLSTAL